MNPTFNIPPTDDIPDPVDVLLEYANEQFERSAALLVQLDKLVVDETLTADQLRKGVAEAILAHAVNEIDGMFGVLAQTREVLTKLDAPNN